MTVFPALSIGPLPPVLATLAGRDLATALLGRFRERRQRDHYKVYNLRGSTGAWPSTLRRSLAARVRLLRLE